MAAAFALAAAKGVATLGDLQPGLWEVTGAEHEKMLARQCVADVTALARFEHRGKTCTSKVLKSSGSEASIEYSCGAAGFGHSDIDVLTPRSLRINTQGISGGLPFNYVLQARRIGDCQKNLATTRH
ncbi:DUF3617 domain-containing protein [Sphingomonas flavescens]|uniref:DUF3617 domain-containing protein n=1 Tax=Sphingomonas flavescens TaxID=3132797 RepID=UPI0028059573|nr:DUF3617 family protein [Sphingomonas limnosediminicola]